LFEQPTEVEGEIREFVRRDVVTQRRSEADSELVASNINSLCSGVQAPRCRISTALLPNADLAGALERRSLRVQRELTDYAHLSQSAMQSTKIMREPGKLEE